MRASRLKSWKSILQVFSVDLVSRKWQQKSSPPTETQHERMKIEPASSCSHTEAQFASRNLARHSQWGRSPHDRPIVQNKKTLPCRRDTPAAQNPCRQDPAAKERKTRYKKSIERLQNPKFTRKPVQEHKFPLGCLAIQHIILQDCSGRRLLEYNGDTRDKAPRWTQVARDPTNLSHKNAGG
jgi:hypothetical protein